MREYMPIMASDTIKRIPWAAIEKHGLQAMRNHGQSLERLAQRGGLSPCEAVAIIEDRRWKRMADVDAESRLRQLCAPLAAEAPKAEGSGQ